MSPPFTGWSGSCAGTNPVCLLTIDDVKTAGATFARGEWPAWFPDSRHILFVARGKEFWEIDTRTRATRRVYAVTRDVIGPPRLTRDGTAAYYSRRVTESDIWMMTMR